MGFFGTNYSTQYITPFKIRKNLTVRILERELIINVFRIFSLFIYPFPCSLNKINESKLFIYELLFVLVVPIGKC